LGRAAGGDRSGAPERALAKAAPASVAANGRVPAAQQPPKG
jgi:hypothetical protein